MPDPVIVRDEEDEDRAAVHALNESAFGRRDEADLVDALRLEGVVLLSLVAELGNEIVGHILFSRMWIDSEGASIAAVALSPMAVLPAYQRQGIGGMLVRHGLQGLRDRGEQIVIVLGHPDYYPRFGFSTERAGGLESPFPPEAYMALELGSNISSTVRGKVRYPTAFGLVS